MLDKYYRPEEVEQRIYKQWEDSGAFKADVNSKAEPYCIMIPPPNVTGSLHMGHALTFTIQDILIRYHRMNGRGTLWQSGTDHAGIATQMVVERQLEEKGISRHDLGREKFVEKIWQWKEESGGAITNQLRRLGASLDWSRERFTMDEGLCEAVTKVFVDLYKDKLIYKDKRLVNWDPKLHTAISDLEVEQRETKGQMWQFRYPVEGKEGTFITVATTRPETMLGDTAVAVHPDDERYKDFVGKNCVLPIAIRPIPIVADEYADPEKGTGAVKITPAHDFKDFEVGRRHKLEMINVFDADAKLNENAPKAYQGMDRFEARKKVIAEMKALDLFAGVDDNDMVIPHGDRSGEVVEPWLTDQWYLDAVTWAKPAIEAVETGKTKFVPKHWENTYFEWMRNILPWCISRQLWWGHQIPAWYGPDGAFFVECTEAEAQAAADKHYGKKTEITRDPDVLDTWFSSQLWPFSTLGWPENTDELKRYYPTDVLVTGFDIIFFWVARMMMSGLHFQGEVPFRDVYIHALVRDEKGQKMSKSKGNVIDPLDLIEKYGTDSLRFTLAALAAQGRDIKLAESRVEGYRNFTTKLWNAARFTEINGCAPDPAFDPAQCSLTINKWIVSKVVETTEVVDQAIKAYRFNDGANALYQFIWGTFCDWYLEFTKPIFDSGDETAITETRAATAWALDQILKLLHPFMPYVTEELWAQLGGAREKLLIVEPWPTFEGALTDQGAMDDMDFVVRIISEIRAVRSEMNVSPKAEVALSHIQADGATAMRLKTHNDLIVRLARLSGIEAAKDVPKGAVQIVVDDVTYALPLADVINLDEEKARLDKEIKKWDSEITRFEKKLGNKKFIDKAPAEVVETEREKLEDAKKSRFKVEEALARLATM
jgi:valyl-tRNA synthetase